MPGSLHKRGKYAVEAIKTHVNIPDDRRRVIDLQIPPTIPTGSTDVGEDDDFVRQRDLGRGDLEWDT
jgi:hypothetical protein